MSEIIGHYPQDEMSQPALLRRIRLLEQEISEYRHTLGHVATCDKGTCPYCPEEARNVLAQNGNQAHG